MKQIAVIVFILVVGSVSIFSDAKAETIPKGTVSLSGSSGAISQSKNAEYRPDRDDINLSIRGGYLIIDNLEFGISFRFNHQDIDDDQERREYTLGQYLIYHYPFDEKSSIYYGGGIGLSDIKTKFDSGGSQKDDGLTLFGELGWEFFINPQVSIKIGFILDRTEYDVDGYVYEDEKILTFRSEIGLTLLF